MNVLNKNGLTALGMIMEIPEDLKTMEIKELLISAGTLRAKKTTKAAAARSDSVFNKMSNMWNKIKSFTIFQEKMEKRDESLLVAASVITAMAYTSAISPPGGVSGIDATNHSAEAGDPYYENYFLAPASSLLAYFYASLSNMFWRANTISFMATLSVIFLYVTGASLKQKLFVWLISCGYVGNSLCNDYCLCSCSSSHYPKILSEQQNTCCSCDWTIFMDVLMLIAILVVAFRCGRYIKNKMKKKWVARKTKINTSEDASTVTTPSNNNV